MGVPLSLLSVSADWACEPAGCQDRPPDPASRPSRSTHDRASVSGNRSRTMRPASPASRTEMQDW